LFLVLITDEAVQEHYDDFFEEIFVELEEKVKVAFVPRRAFCTVKVKLNN